MANEIALSGTLSVNRIASGAVAASLVGSFSALATLVDEDIGAATQAFSANAAVETGGVTSPGYLFIKNTSTTGNLLLYLDSGSTQRFATLKPGEGIPIPAPNTMYAAASAGTVIAHIVAAKA